MALYQGVLSSSNLRLRGYRVTNGLNFFLQIFRITRLRGYQGLRGLTCDTGVTIAIKGSSPHQMQGYEVTKVTVVTGVTIAIKGSSPQHMQGYAVTRLPTCG